MRTTSTRTYGLSWLAGLLLLATGCQNECSPIKAAYNQALQEEKALVDTRGSREKVSHFGVSMKLDLLNQVIAKALRTATGELFELERTSSVMGQDIGFKAKGRLNEAVLSAEPGCPNCVRIAGQLGGTLDLTLPVVGQRTIPLKAPLTLVAPLVFTERDGQGVIQLDFKAMLKLGKSSFKLPTENLPAPWNELVQGKFLEAMLATVSDRVGVVELYRFSPPALGIEGLEVLPLVLELNPQTGVLFAGMSSNLPGLSAGTPGLAPFTGLAGGNNLAMGVHKQVLLPVMVSLFRSGQVPRAYDADGNPNERGPFFLTLRSMDLAAAAKADAKQGHPFKLGFQLYHLPSDGMCYSVDAEASGRLKLVGGQVKVGIEKATVLKTSLPDVLKDLANWGGTQYLTQSAQVLRSAIDPTSLALPGSELEISSGLLQVREQGLYVAAKAGLKGEHAPVKTATPRAQKSGFTPTPRTGR